MMAFEVQDMTCGHCASRITRSLKSVDPSAQVTIDPAKRLVLVESEQADAQAIGEAIVDAGYTPVAVEAVTIEASAPGGTCCRRGR